MKTLLKDLPEFAERIESNYLLNADISEIVADCLDHTNDYTSETEPTEKILSIITDFVNQNYEWKGLAK